MKTLVKGNRVLKTVCFGVIAAMMIALLSPIRVEAKNGNSGSYDLNVDYHSKTDIAKYLNNCSFDYAYKNNYDSVPSTSAPYSLGKVSDRTLVDSIAVLNAIRYIAGIPYNVTLDPQYVELTQAASVVMAANDDLTHSPARPSGMSDELYSKGKTGAGSSNIAAGWGYGNLDNWFNIGYFIESCWMSDDDNGNIPMVGHRRWLLNPTMGKTGFGIAKTPDSKGIYSAVYAFDRSNTAGSSYNGVAWPAQNTPVKYFVKTDPWSLSTGEYISSAAVVVTCENTGAKWEFSGDAGCNKNTEAGYFNINNGGYGQTGCIIFRPNNIVVEKEYSYNVSVSTDIGRSYTYTVDFFDPADYLNAEPEPDPEPAPVINQGDVEDFVSRFYTIILDRDAEPEGLANWTTALMAGTRGGADVADEFIHSAEYQAKHDSDEEYLTKLYKAFFGREPDAAGKASWMQTMAEGKDRDYVLDGFLASDEYRDLCKKYGIKRESTRTFVKRFYTIILGRTSDNIQPSELDNWQIALDSKTMAGADIAEQFMHSAEFNLTEISDKEYLEKLYKAFFNRGMDDQGYLHWTEEFAVGKNRDYILNEFLKSLEFKDLCAEYGINPGR